MEVEFKTWREMQVVMDGYFLSPSHQRDQRGEILIIKMGSKTKYERMR